ncbi:MAG: L-aspartate oxidase [Elusimicrobiota bacterium]
MGNNRVNSDVLIIGSGAAGLSLALRLASKYKINVISKAGLEESSTFYAQGGIAAAWDEKDSLNEHINDTIIAGDGLCKKNVVSAVIKEGPGIIKDLIDWGVKFTKCDSGSGEFDLTKEGGHTKRRIFHKDDTTGVEIETSLSNKVKKQKNISVYEYHIAINLIKHKQACCGAYVLNEKKGSVITFCAPIIVLATGGTGKVYVYTSNPDTATGDGIAMAYRIGAKISNMEFMQFHPTCLYHPKAKSFLISEAVRGEGGILRLANGKAFMHKYHKLGSLAPRDVVARAIDCEIKKSGDVCVFLDITHKNKNFIKKRFPNIYEKCLLYGIDITKEPAPVVPAAHYMCGGIKIDMNGRTNIKNLYAVGETACTGLHGANRLASNSLLEAFFTSKRAAEYIKNNFPKIAIPKIKPWSIGKAVDSNEQVMITHNWYELRRLMWNYVGIVRSNARLARARSRIKLLISEIQEYYWDFTVTAPLIELRNLATVADLIIRSAQKRKESRGLHYSLDYPKKNPKKARDTVL